MSNPVTLQLSRGKLIALLACLVSAALLLFVAGTATGILVASQGGGPKITNLKRPEASSAAPGNSKPETSEQGTERGDASEPHDTEEAAAEIPGSGSAGPVANPGGTPPLEATLPQPVTTPAGKPNPAEPPAATPEEPNADAQKPSGAHPGGPISSTGDDSDKIPLTIKVCSFSSKTSADKLMVSLAEHGYQATLTHSMGADGRAWYVVRLGPYAEWDTASAVAAQVAIAENVRPVVGPAR